MEAPVQKFVKRAKSYAPFSLSILYKAQTNELITVSTKHPQNSTIKNKATSELLFSKLTSVATINKLKRCKNN